MADHVGIWRNVQRFKEGWQTNAVNALTGTLMLKRIISKEVDDFTGKFYQAVKIFIAIQLDERHDHGAHKIANLQGALATHKNAGTLVIPRRQGFWHNVEAMHATHAASIVDFDGVIVIQRNGVARAACDHTIDEIFTANFFDKSFDFAPDRL